MPYPWAKLLPDLCRNQNGLCYYCRQWCIMPREAACLPGADVRPKSVLWNGVVYELASVEHLTPRCEGGKKMGAANVVMACIRCNGKRNDEAQRKNAKALRKAKRQTSGEVKT